MRACSLVRSYCLGSAGNHTGLNICVGSFPPIKRYFSTVDPLRKLLGGSGHDITADELLTFKWTPVHEPRTEP